MPAAGTAWVSVHTPGPGGGTTSAIAFTIDPPATLTVNASTVAPGSPVTVTLTYGFGGASDWLALARTNAPDASYLQWTWVGTGVTDRTWAVTMPDTVGTYEFRLFGEFDSRRATSPPVTVDASLNPIPITTSLSPSSVLAGGPAFTLTVNGSGFRIGSAVRWNGVNRPTTFVSAAQLQASIGATDIAAPGIGGRDGVHISARRRRVCDGAAHDSWPAYAGGQHDKCRRRRRSDGDADKRPRRIVGLAGFGCSRRGKQQLPAVHLRRPGCEHAHLDGGRTGHARDV